MTTLLVDSNNLIMRCYLAPKGGMSVDDEDTGTLVLFINSLARYFRLEKPDRALIAWDGGHSAFRLRIFPEYKANRKDKFSDKPQPPFKLVQKFLWLAGVPQQSLPGYEGDDLIAASWRACSGRRRVIILSSDKDLFQLVQGDTEQLKLTANSERPDRWDGDRIEREMGFKAEHSVYVQALMGDKVDNIPGLPRVGPKTAIKMLKEYNWDMGLLLESLTPEQQDRVLLNIALVDLGEVPLELEEPPELQLVGPGSGRWPQLMEFCDRYELKQIKYKLESNSLWVP